MHGNAAFEGRFLGLHRESRYSFAVFGPLLWLAPSLVPAIVFALLVYRSDRDREPRWLVALTFALGALFAFGALTLERKAAALTGLALETRIAGERDALVFTFAVAAPLREAAKVAATWAAFRSRHFDEAYDGLVYPAAAALGFAAIESALMLRATPTAIGTLRAALALPAHDFFSVSCGYALRLAGLDRTRRSVFPAAWLAATLMHGLYLHFVYGRGPGALLGAAPLLAAMALITWLGARDLRARDDKASSRRSRLSRLSVELPRPPSFKAVRAALTHADQPVLFRWIGFGALTTLGSMLLGLAVAVAVGHYAHVDFAAVDERDLRTTAPVALLGLGLLLSFPVSGYLVARASGAASLLEPALAAGIALLVVVAALGALAPTALVFAVAFAPIAFSLACLGAWVAPR